MREFFGDFDRFSSLMGTNWSIRYEHKHTHTHTHQGLAGLGKSWSHLHQCNRSAGNKIIGCELFTYAFTEHSLPCIDGNYFNQRVLPDLGQIQPSSSQSFPFLLLLTQQTNRVTLNTNTVSHARNGTESSCHQPWIQIDDEENKGLCSIPT